MDTETTDSKEVAKKATKDAGGNGAQQETIELSKLDIKEAKFKIVGVRPLIVHRFGQKAIKMIEDKQQQKVAAKAKKKARKPDEEFKDSLYMMNNKKDSGFPAVGIKAAMVRAGTYMDWKMTQLRGVIHVFEDEIENGLIKIKGTPKMRTDMVRLASNVSDVRYRGVYEKWSMDVRIQYNASVISLAQVADILRMAGYSCGLGEWRPEKSNSGSYGTFELAS